MASQGNAASLSEPRSIVQSLTSKFHATADVAAIGRINQAFERVRASRAENLAVSRDTLHQWMKKVEAAKWEAQRPADRSETAHAERMAKVERDRYSLAKAVNDLELAVQREEAKRGQFNDRLTLVRQALKSMDEGGIQINEDKIRSLVFREMGISWILEESVVCNDPSNWHSLPSKCRIFSRKSNDVFTLSFAPNSNSFEDAHQIWEHLGK